MRSNGMLLVAKPRKGYIVNLVYCVSLLSNHESLEIVHNLQKSN